jgi:hypothetical protein
MTEFEVLRDSRNNLLKVGNDFYSLSQVVDTVFEIVKQHSTNPAFDVPGWFYSGSPYEKEICALGIQPLKYKPTEFIPEFLPRYPQPPWRSREPMWPQIFNCEVLDI